MSLSKSRKSIKNLTKIKKIMEVSKFATLQELSKISKVTNNALEFSVIAKEMFEKVSKKYKITSKFHTKTTGNKTLWVYIPIEQSMLSGSNELLEKKLLKYFNPFEDLLIVVGSPGKKFADKNNIVPELFISNPGESNLTLTSAISTLFETKNIDKVSVVYHSGIPEPTTILPISNTSFSKESSINISMNSKFFPSLHESMDIVSHTYVLHTISAIISKSKYFTTKQKLLRHEQSIKSIEEKLEEKIKTTIKGARLAQTDEMLLIAGNAKRLKEGDYE